MTAPPHRAHARVDSPLAFVRSFRPASPERCSFRWSSPTRTTRRPARPCGLTSAVSLSFQGGGCCCAARHLACTVPIHSTSPPPLPLSSLQPIQPNPTRPDPAQPNPTRPAPCRELQGRVHGPHHVGHDPELWLPHSPGYACQDHRRATNSLTHPPNNPLKHPPRYTISRPTNQPTTELTAH